jgi:hypothetical protein
MTLQASGAISLADIQTEFGGVNPASLNEYYRGAGFVPSGVTAVPASGTISLLNFYGTTGSTVVQYVLNSTFDTDLSGWAYYSYPGGGTTEVSDSSVASRVANRLRLTVVNSSNTFPTAVATLSALTIGATYTVSLNYYTGSAVIYIGNGLLYTNGNIYNSGVQSTSGATYSFTFVATQTTHYLQLESEATALNAYTEFDNVTVYQMLLSLTLSNLSATPNSAWSSTINNKSSGSTVTATSSDGTTLTASGTTVSGTFTTSGSKTVTLTETLGVANNSPKMSTQTVSVVSPVLQVLTLSTTTATQNVSWSSTINNRATGSTITATNTTNSQSLTVSGSTVSGTFTSTGTKTITLVETLSGATGSPRTSTATVTVSPPNFVPNGTFDTDLTGWSYASYDLNTSTQNSDTGIATRVNNKLRLTCLDSATRTYCTATANISGLTIGRTYTLTSSYNAVNCSGGVEFFIGSLDSGSLTTGTSYTHTFVADATTMFLTIQINTSTVNESADFDNISIT